MRSANRCCKCGCEIWIPDALYEAASASRGPKGIHFYCAYGHGQHFVEGETEAEKLRRERDRLAQQIAQRDDEINRERERREAAERQAAAARGQVTKMKKRASAGTCPCCNRTFLSLQSHIAKKHPQFAADAGVNVVQIKRTA